MRKEVKLGMAIGGGLIAVLVVYLFVAPPANNKNGAQLATGGGAGGNGSIIEITQPGEPLAAGAAGTDDKGTVGKIGGAETAGQAAFGNAASPNAQTALHDAGNEQPAAPAGKSKDPWKRALVDGKSEKIAAPTPAPAGTLAKATPVKDREPAVKPTAIKHDVMALGTPATGDSEPKLYFKPNDAWGGGVSTHDLLGAAESHATKSSTGRASVTHAAPAAAAAPVAASAGRTAEGTHVVQSGDTLSSIAIEAYGSAAYYPHILRANPTVNPNNMKLGTTLILPKADEVKTIAVASERPTGVVASVVQDVKIDPKTQYQVQSGDSLYKISLKVYGKSTFVERIYEKNKAAIGSDPKKLKLGMILELPEKATVAAVASPSQERVDSSIENDRR
ncbi:MAG: Peptidoglycan-binding LysM [Phycisphaerales bacterium]|nr:Peptidoglycan-binding LysM [Phycisphaerales bacterium]